VFINLFHDQIWGHALPLMMHVKALYATFVTYCVPWLSPMISPVFEFDELINPESEMLLATSVVVVNVNPKIPPVCPFVVICKVTVVWDMFKTNCFMYEAIPPQKDWQVGMSDEIVQFTTCTESLSVWLFHNISTNRPPA